MEYKIWKNKEDGVVSISDISTEWLLWAMAVKHQAFSNPLAIKKAESIIELRKKGNGTESRAEELKQLVNTLNKEIEFNLIGWDKYMLKQKEQLMYKYKEDLEATNSVLL